MDTRVDWESSALKPPFAARYDNFIGGKWVAPAAGRYFDNVSPITMRAGIGVSGLWRGQKSAHPRGPSLVCAPQARQTWMDAACWRSSTARAPCSGKWIPPR